MISHFVQKHAQYYKIRPIVILRCRLRFSVDARIAEKRFSGTRLPSILCHWQRIMAKWPGYLAKYKFSFDSIP